MKVMTPVEGISVAWANAASREPRPGDRIERYELIQPIARGGMGSVWAAQLHGTLGFEKIVAIKTVLPDLATDTRVRAMFLDEARLASAVVHRNVAHILDFLECDGALYLVMDWVDGASLKMLHDMLAARRERMPHGVLLRVLADICAGLHAAHQLRDSTGAFCDLVHRDVSPQNILVGVEGAAKLIDFGVAKTRHRAAQETTFGALKGKLHFMAPEQARGEAVDRRADVWSVGATLFYMLTGHGPFEMNERSDTLRLLISGRACFPLPADVHPAIARIVNGCLAPRREDRFTTAEDLGNAIEDAIEEMGVSATSRDVAAFVAESAGAQIAEQRRGMRLGVIDPLSTSMRGRVTPDTGLVAPDAVRWRMRARRLLPIAAFALFCIVPAATYSLVRRDAFLTDDVAAAVPQSSATQHKPEQRQEPLEELEVMEVAPAPPPSVISPAVTPSARPSPARGHSGGARAVRPKTRPSAIAVAAGNPKRNDDFGTAVESRK